MIELGLINKYVRILKENNIEHELLDYDNTLAAKGKEMWTFIAYTYRPERDGYLGFKILDEKDFMKWVEDNK